MVLIIILVLIGVCLMMRRAKVFIPTENDDTTYATISDVVEVVTKINQTYSSTNHDEGDYEVIDREEYTTGDTQTARNESYNYGIYEAMEDIPHEG